MIKNDEMKRLRAQAERSGESSDVWAYVEALEERLASPHSACLYDPNDAERTEQTKLAHVEAQSVLDGQLELGTISGPVQIVAMPNAIYILEARGQASATAHGYQGFRPSRGELLRRCQEAGLPVFLAFKDGGVWETAWLEELPPAKPLKLSGSRDEKRFGWYAGEKVERGEPLFARGDHLAIPLAHDPKPQAQAGLV